MSPRRQGAGRVRQTPPARGGLSRRARRRLAIALILVLIGVAASWGYTRSGARPSEMAPAFALPASTGETVRLEAFRGKLPVVLAFQRMRHDLSRGVGA